MREKRQSKKGAKHEAASQKRMAAYEKQKLKREQDLQQLESDFDNETFNEELFSDLLQEYHTKRNKTRKSKSKSKNVLVVHKKPEKGESLTPRVYHIMIVPDVIKTTMKCGECGGSRRKCVCDGM
jgi:hypothetical protein